MLLVIINGVYTGLLNLCLGFNSIGFYHTTKLAIYPLQYCRGTLFLNKVCDFELRDSVRHQIVYQFVSLYLSLRKFRNCIGADSGFVYKSFPNRGKIHRINRIIVIQVK